MYHLEASVGADAHKSTINPDDEILTVLGGKASCRRKFVINVHLLDEEGNSVNEEFAVIASVAYAHDRSPIVQDENLFLAEPPLLTTFNGVEYPSQDRPTRLVGGKASFKLAISLLSSKYDNRLFCICFTPQSSSSTPEFSGSTSACLPGPCFSKPIRSISRKRSSSSAAPPLPISYHVPPQADATMLSPPPASKVKSPESAASEEVEKFFRVSSATSSSEEDDKTNCQNYGDVASDSSSFRYIAGNCKQEAQLLLQPDAIHGDPYYSTREGYMTRKDPFFIGIDGAECEGYLIRRDPLMQFEATHYESFPNTFMHPVEFGGHESLERACIHMDSIQHHHHHFDGFSTQREAMLVTENGLNYEGFCAKEPIVLIDNQQKKGFPNHKDSLVHVQHGGGCYMDASGRLGKVDMLINGRFSPNPVASQSESSSPISGNLTSDGSTEQTDAFSCITAVPTTERPLSALHPGSHQLSSPFRPYHPNAGASRASTSNFEQGGSSSPLYMNGSRRESPEGLLLFGRPIPDSTVQSTLTTSCSKRSFDAVLRVLTESSNSGISDSGVSPDLNIESEEKSLLALEVALQDAIKELAKKKEELCFKRQRLLEDDEAHMQNIVFQSSSWVEGLSGKYNY